MPLQAPTFHLDAISFWTGIVTASLLWWFIGGFRKVWPAIKYTIQTSTRDSRTIAANTVEEKYRREIVRQVQGAHLAFSLFSLDEILVTPRLLAPPPQASPETGPANEDLISQTVLYTPEWPELAGSYRAPTLEIYEPLTSGNYLAVYGQPGCGKSTALSYLTCIIARRESPSAELNELIPICLHADDLPIPFGANIDAAKILIDLATRKAPATVASQLPGLIRESLASGRILLVVDGVDELPATSVREVSNFFNAAMRSFPSIRIATAVAPEYWDGLAALGFRGFALAHWSHLDIDCFLDQWSRHWSELIDPLLPEKKSTVDPTVLRNWLTAAPAVDTPFNRTLITWAVYAGDCRGPRLADAIEAHLRRQIEPSHRKAIQQIALQMELFALPTLSKSEIQSALASVSPEAVAAVSAAAGPADKPGASAQKPSAGSLPFRFLLENGVLSEHCEERYRFFHPILTAYLAAHALSETPGQTSRLVSQQGWVGKHLTLRFSGSLMDISGFIEPFLLDVEEPLYRNIFTAAHWLRDCQGNPVWKNRVLRSLVEMVQSDMVSPGMRQRALTALVCSADGNLSALFKQLLGVKSVSTVQLAALACGALRDEKLVPDLVGLLSNLNSEIASCSCLALVAIGAQAGLEGVTRTLLTGDEQVRHAAAEALSNHPGEGYAVLKDGSTLNDLLVRRSVVFGLSRVREAWAKEILDKMRIEDGQWVVRNAAAQAMEEMDKPNPRIPKLLVPPAQSPWLIAFAAKQGLGIGGNSPAVDILVLALKMGDEEERLAALDYLRELPKPEVIAAVFDAAYNGVGTVREAAINTLYEYAASGITLPAPAVFGLGKASLR